MWKCENCGSEVDRTHETCWNCGTGKDGSPPADKPQSEESRAKTLVAQSSAEPSAFASALRVCGVINLIASLIGGYIISGVTHHLHTMHFREVLVITLVLQWLSCYKVYSSLFSLT
jgi:hypothetical protein